MHRQLSRRHVNVKALHLHGCAAGRRQEVGDHHLHPRRRSRGMPREGKVRGRARTWWSSSHMLSSNPASVMRPRTHSIARKLFQANPTVGQHGRGCTASVRGAACLLGECRWLHLLRQFTRHREPRQGASKPLRLSAPPGRSPKLGQQPQVPRVGRAPDGTAIANNRKGQHQHPCNCACAGHYFL